jgi:hypothetical protein
MALFVRVRNIIKFLPNKSENFLLTLLPPSPPPSPQWGEGKGKMKLKKTLFIQFVILMMTLLFLYPCFSQVKIGETISFSGVIQSIHRDSNFIVINEVRIYMSPDTKIVNEDGDILPTDTLQSRQKVMIEASRSKEGFYAKKIILKKKK